MTTINVTIDAPSANAGTRRALDRIAEAANSFLASLQPDEIEVLAEQLVINAPSKKFSKAEIAFAAKFGANEIGDEEKRELEFAALKRFFEWRQHLLKNSLTSTQVAELLKTSRQTPHDRLRKKGLVAIQDNGVWKFPIWQFDAEGPDGVIAGLPDVLKALEIPDYSKISWLTRSHPCLDGLTPIEALKQGQKAKVMAEAKAVGVA